MSLLIGASSGLQGAAGSSAGGAADLGVTIEQSLRFSSSSSPRLTRTFAQNHSSNSSTVSYWLKRGKLGTLQTVGTMDNGVNEIFGRFNTSDQYQVINGSGGRTTTQRFRDTNAWYHIFFNQTKLYINGVLEHTGTLINGITGSDKWNIGQYGANLTQYFDGYIAEFHFVDGTNKDETDFGKFNGAGVWVPIEYTGSHGTNGFHLKFDSSGFNGSGGIGADHSGNGNDFTASNFESTAISSSNFDNDIDYEDTPTSNYPILSPIAGRVQVTTSKANLTQTSSANFWQTSFTTHGITTGKWYWECELTTKASTSDTIFGIATDVNLQEDNQNGNYPGQSASSWGYYHHQGQKINAGTFSAYGDAYAQGDIIGFAFDADTGTIWASKNGTWQNSATQSEIEAGTTTNSMFTGISGNVFFPVTSTSYTSGFNSINLGQRDFVYTAPSGYSKLQSNNLSEPTIKDGRDHFEVLTWDGDGTADRAITGLEFQPALVWIKNRDATNLDYIVADGIMGNNRRLRSNTSDAFGSTTDFRTFTSDGFTLGDQSITNGGSSPNTYVAWCWNAPSSNSSNGNGDITTTIRANTDAGFCVMRFTGSTSAQKLGHGLTAEPEFVISKCIGVGSTSWQIYHKTLGVGSFLPFSTSAMSNISGHWGAASDWNATTCGCSNNDSDNNKTDEFMHWYIWHGVEGFSKFGDYKGNGSANGTFVYLGFKPRLVVIRAAQTGTNGQEPWFVYDTAREPNNVMNQPLEWNAQHAEGATSRDIDFLSNGFKLRSAANQVNGSGTNYIYAAWASHPYGGENAPPATAH